MARRFTAASSEKITLNLGQLGFAFGPGTIAAVVRFLTVNAVHFIIEVGASQAAEYAIRLNASGIVELHLDGGSVAGVTPLTANKWYLVAGTKATGTVAPRFHIYDFAARTWIHENSGVTHANSLVPITNGGLGMNPGGTGSFMDGDIAAGAVWNVVLTDTQIESLAQDVSIANWNGYTKARGIWIPDRSPAVAVVDLSGGGAGQSAIVGTTATADEFPLFNASVETSPIRRRGLLSYGTPRRLGREREIERLFRAVIRVYNFVTDSGTSAFTLATSSAAERIADAASTSFAITTAGADKVTDSGTSSFALATVKTAEAIKDTASTIVALVRGFRRDGIGDAGTSSSTFVTGTVLEGPGDAAQTLVVLTTAGAGDRADAGTSALVIVGTSAEELVDQGESDFELVTGSVLDAIADEGSSTLTLVQSGVEAIAFSDAGESDFTLDTAGADALADAETSPLELDAASVAEAIADGGTSDVVLVTFGFGVNFGTSTLTLTTGGIEGAQWATSTLELDTAGADAIADRGTSLVIVQTGGTYTPSMRGASIVRLLTGGSVLDQAGTSPFRLVTGGTGYVSEPVQSGETAIVISTRGVGVVIGPGIITAEESCCIDLAEPVPIQYRN